MLVNKSIKLSLFLLCIYATFSLNGHYTHLLLYTAIPTSLVLSWVGTHKPQYNIYIGICVSLFLWIVFCSLFAYNIELANRQVHRVVGVFMLVLSIYFLSLHKKIIPYIYMIWVIMYLACFHYAQNHLLEDFDFTQDRVTDSALNANTLGYYTFFVTSIVFYWGEVVHKRLLKIILHILFLLSIPLSFYVAIITASRQILIIQIPLIGLLLSLRYFKGKKFGPLILAILVAYFGIYYFGEQTTDIYEQSYLNQRYDSGIENDIRTMLIMDAIKTGIDNPIVGVGPGCCGYYNYGRNSFSHCTYTELFANTGVLGAFLFISLIVIFMVRQIKRYFKTRDSFYLYFLVVGFIYALDNMFYVFYLDPWLMSFFIIIANHSEVYFKSTKHNHE